MNSLSWMIYLADVAGSLNGFLIFIAAISGIGAAISLIVWLAMRGDGPSLYNSDSEERKAKKQAGWDGTVTLSGKLVHRLPVLCVAASLAASLLPSSGTVYAIAASELGESALNTTTGNKAVLALNAWLDRQIAGEDEAE